MTTDIVTVLDALAADPQGQFGTWGELQEIAIQARNEIKRLRSEYRKMRSYASHRASCPNPYGMGACRCGYDELFMAKGPRQQELSNYDDTFQ